MIYLGFDPGGIGKFGCACLDGDTGTAHLKVLSSVDEAIKYVSCVKAKDRITAAGIDTLLHWQSTRSGWRPADVFLRSMYPKTKSSVIAPNALYSSMTVQGAALAFHLRKKWPEINLTETHPKVLWQCINKNMEYPRDKEIIEDKNKKQKILSWLKTIGIGIDDFSNTDDLDALISAYAAKMGYEKKWKRDLIEIENFTPENQSIKFVENTHYYWPE